MAFLTSNGTLPPIYATTSHEITADERSSAIDFVNRLNHLFEEFDKDKMKSGFLPECKLRHAYGTFNGRAEMDAFIERDYPPLVPGISRHATNHTVDRDDETGGVVVRYHNMLVRYAWPSQAHKVTPNGVIKAEDGLPGMWYWAPMVDRLKMTEEGWKVYERFIGGSVVNSKFDPDAEPKTQA
ncbi:hypothetical protein EDB80DRAFT_743012 [Ilyonectria destructans]|nr:hypothetical protein EDB80DRAFT_743012 [Ilyonectria destructans]